MSVRDYRHTQTGKLHWCLIPPGVLFSYKGEDRRGRKELTRRSREEVIV